MTSDKIKIACLHGYGTNAKFLERQMKSFRKKLAREIQFVFVEGDIIAPEAFILDNKVIQLIDGEPKSWTAFKSYHNDYEDYVQNILNNVKKSLEDKSSHYDGILGFSQGTTIIHALLKFMQSGKIKWKCLEDLKFSILVCATNWRWRDTDQYRQIDLPSLHLLSASDFLYRKSLLNTTQYKNPVTIYHPFGHSFPRLGVLEVEQIKAFMMKSMKKKGVSQLLPKL